MISILIWLASLQGFPVGEVLPSRLLSSYSLTREIRISDRRPVAIPPPVLAQVNPNSTPVHLLRLYLYVTLSIFVIFGVSAGVWWLSRYRFIPKELEDVPTGHFAVEIKRMEDRPIRMRDGLLAKIHAVAFVMIENNKDAKEKAQNHLANSEGEITQESVAAAVMGYLEVAIATVTSNKYFQDILSNDTSFMDEVGQKIQESLKTLGLTVVKVGLVEIEGQNPYGKEYAVPVELEGVQTDDNLQADLKTVFFVKIPDLDSQSNHKPLSSVLLEKGEVTQKRIEIAVRQRAIPALRSAASEVKLKEIDYSQFSSDGSGSSGSFATKVSSKLRLSGTGLELVGLVISDIDGADIYETEYAVEVELAGPNALRAKDFLRADIRATFLVKLCADNDKDIDKAYSALSEGEAISRKRIIEAVHKRASAALQIEGFKQELKEIHDERDKFAEKVKDKAEDQLKDLGLTLKEVIITEIEESDYYLDNANDYFDIQGIAKRAKLIGQKEVEKRELELQTELELEKKELENQRESLKTIQEKEQLAITQEIALEQNRLEAQTNLKQKQAEEQIKVETAEANAATKIAESEIKRLDKEAQRVKAEEGVNTAIEEARKARGEILDQIAVQEAERIRVLANADAESKKTVSELHPLAMIVTTLAPQLMEHLPEIAEIAKAMSLPSGALSNAHIYNMADGNGKGLNNMVVPGGLANVLTAIVDKLDLHQPPNSYASANGNGSKASQLGNSFHTISPLSNSGGTATVKVQGNGLESKESVPDLLTVKNSQNNPASDNVPSELDKDERNHSDSSSFFKRPWGN